MKNSFTALFRARDKPRPQDAVSATLAFYFGSSGSGKSVTTQTAIQLSTVYACVRVMYPGHRGGHNHGGVLQVLCGFRYSSRLTPLSMRVLRLQTKSILGGLSR